MVIYTWIITHVAKLIDEGHKTITEPQLGSVILIIRILFAMSSYEVPIVYQDIRQAEGFYQIFDALDNLDKVVEDVFTRISTRVYSYLTRILLIR